MGNSSGPTVFKLSRVHRIIIMGVLITSFFIISPLVILYTAGFRYDWTNNRIATTGVLSIDVQPVDVQVYVNDVLIHKKIPIRLANVAPGNYHIRIERDGYRPWIKDMSIFSNQTTFIKNITLFKNTEPRLEQTINLDDITHIWTVANEPRSLLTVIKSATSTAIKKISFESKQENILFTIPKQTPFEITMAPAHDQFAIILPGMQSTQTSIISLVDPSLQTSNIHESTSITYQWSKPQPGADLYLADGKNLKRISLYRSPALITSLLYPIWFVDATQTIWVVKDKTLTTLDASDTTSAFSVEKPINSIIDTNDNRSLFSIPGGILVVIRHADGQESRIIPAIEYLYQPNTREWWAWSTWELASIYTSGKVSILNRSSEPITTIHALDEFGVNVTANDQRLIGFNPGYYMSQPLAEFTHITMIDVDQVNRSIYIVGTRSNQTGIFSLAY